MSGRDFAERDIHLALDGELPEDERTAYAAWLEASPDMRARASRFDDDMAQLRAAVGHVTDEAVPERLRAAVGDLPRADAPRWWLAAAAAAAIFVLGGIAGHFADKVGLPMIAREEPPLADRAIDAYATFAVAQSRPVEVTGEDKGYLEAWLSKRTGLKLVAPDLTAQGFDLLGGRILPAGGHTAALLVYGDQSGNQVSIYMTAEGEAKTRGVYVAEEGGPVATYWLDKGFACAIVSSVPDPRRDEVVGSAWRQIKAGLTG